MRRTTRVLSTVMVAAALAVAPAQASASSLPAFDFGYRVGPENARQVAGCALWFTSSNEEFASPTMWATGTILWQLCTELHDAGLLFTVDGQQLSSAPQDRPFPVQTY
ncbi:hypothetical protein [Corynebacterium halotolerans]|uniref:Secreted protein n=1 Tax=Corynebacterium halotolerans YIM 70093 = DSM 44683 TaxID=1121362 RepID=M1P495_9CORY|nr:hypothetical protein [Corynebacterium halotolerans]AGF71461.1 hypothetical protein A605_02235 [Corynebacterium halotolerans YIM 70093 = DSM 44683]